MKSVVRFSRFVVAPLFVVACQSASDDPVTDTNTNWLEVCEESDTCGGLECLCDVCTRECETDADCSGLDEGAVCSRSEESSCGGSSVCVEAERSGGDDEDGNDDDGPTAVAEPEPTSVNSECNGEAPSCSSCEGLQPATCMDAIWICPPLPGEPCPGPVSGGECEDEPPGCPDGCGGLVSPNCVDRAWVCPTELDTGCPSGGAGGGNSGMGGVAGLAGAGGECSANCSMGGNGGTSGGASSGGASSGGTAGVGGTSSGGTAGVGGTSSGGTAGATVTDPCEGAMVDQACEVEGVSCGNCTNPCEFCNMLRCSLGFWSRLEAFPAPCFECGMDLTCQQYEAVCRIENGAVYDEECVPVPEACRDDLSCGCLESEIPEFTCTEASAGSFVVERSDSGSQ